MPDPAVHRLLVGLSVSGEPGPPVSDGIEVARVVDVLGNGAAEWAVDFSRRCFDAVVAEIGNQRPTRFFSTLRRAIERSGCELLLVLDGHENTPRLNSDQLAIVEALAREEVPFARIVEGLRLVHRKWSRELLDRVEAHLPGGERLPLLHAVTESMTAYFDHTIDAVITEHLNERQRLMAQRINNRREVVAAILAGQPVDPVVVREALGLDPDQHHLAFLLWRDEPDELDPVGGPHGYLERIAQDVCRLLGCPEPIAAHTDATTFRAAASRQQPFEDGDVAVLHAQRWDRGLRIAVGRPGTGIAGYRRSHLTAEDAQRLARSLPLGSTVVVHRDVALTTLLAADLERARWFASEELGRLAADDEDTVELRRTLLTYLDHGGSLVRAAAELHVHRNTVVYRLRRVERILGRSATERVLETHVALRLAGMIAIGRR